MADRNKLHQELTELSAKEYLLECDLARLRDRKLTIKTLLWEAPVEPKFGLCRMCKKQTKELFGGLPQCSVHIVKGKGPAVLKILDELIYGE